jgi:hypothetical protein
VLLELYAAPRCAGAPPIDMAPPPPEVRHQRAAAAAADIVTAFTPWTMSDCVLLNEKFSDSNYNLSVNTLSSCVIISPDSVTQSTFRPSIHNLIHTV